jgi:hypothetical protein
VVAKGNVDLSKQKVTIKDEYGTKKLYFMTTKQWNKFYGRSGGGDDRGSVNTVDKAKEKAKDLLNKGKKKGHITITTDPDLVVAEGNVDLSKQKVTIKDEYGTKNLYFMTTKQCNKFYGKSGGGGEGRGSANPVDKAKDKAKDLFNKGKNLFKKKK